MLRPLQAVRFFCALIICVSCMPAAAAVLRYPNMAPVAQYRMRSRAAEIALARSAAPTRIAEQAEVLVLGQHGYRTAVAGGNGFVCLVVRSWDQGFHNPELWNPKIRSPECFNAAAARSVLSRYLERTRWVLAGVSMAKMRELSGRVRAGWKAGEPAPGAMCYMLSENGYLNDEVRGPWRPHVMFFLSGVPDSSWGANVDGSPMFADSTNYKPVTIFMVVVPKWSNGRWAGRPKTGG